MNKELIKGVKDLIADVEKTHRYSMSRIYGLYNTVFNKNEAPQSCASCLIRKVKELKDWLAKVDIQEQPEDTELDTTNVDETKHTEIKVEKKKGRKKKGE